MQQALPTSWATWARASSPTARTRASTSSSLTFGVVDPDVSAADEATRNDERPETQAWAARLRALVEGEPRHHNYDEIYRTDFGAFATR
jgi:hypothetical protein